VVIRLSCITMAQVFSTFSLDLAETGRPAFLKTREPSEDLYMTQTVIAAHMFQVLVHFSGSFPRLNVKFNHGTLLYVENFDTRNRHTLTSTAIKQLLVLQRRACFRCKNHTPAVTTVYYFVNLFAGRSEKKWVSFFNGHTVYHTLNTVPTRSVSEIPTQFS
jgi:hypothetical protein